MSDTVWYRYAERHVAPVTDEWDRPRGPARVEVHRYSYPVLRETPKGVWLNEFGHKRFVRRAARKRFACPTPAEALESFKARKERQLAILREQVRSVEIALQKAAGMSVAA